MGYLFPDKVRVQLPFQNAEVLAIATLGGGTPAGYWGQKGFGMTNMYNIDPSITSHQPRGWNQWITMYERSLTVSADVYLKLVTTTETNDSAGVVCLYQSELGTAEITGSSAYYDNLERMHDPTLNARWKHFDGMGGGKTNWVMLNKKFYSRSSQEGFAMEDLIMLTDGTGAPIIEREFHVFIRCPQRTTSTNFLIEVYVTFDIIFMQPKNVTGS